MLFSKCLKKSYHRMIEPTTSRDGGVDGSGEALYRLGTENGEAVAGTAGDLEASCTVLFVSVEQNRRKRSQIGTYQPHFNMAMCLVLLPGSKSEVEGNAWTSALNAAPFHFRRLG